MRMGDIKTLKLEELPLCPVETTVYILNNKWKVLILRDLFSGAKRFGELKFSIGKISAKILIANLRSMEEDGLLTRRQYPEIPPRVEYELTELGQSLSPIIDQMRIWGMGYKRKRSGLE